MTSRVLNFLPAWLLGWLFLSLLLWSGLAKLWNALLAPHTGIQLRADLSPFMFIWLGTTVLFAYLCLRRFRIGYLFVFASHILIALTTGLALSQNWRSMRSTYAVLAGAVLACSTISMALLLRPTALAFYFARGVGTLPLPRGRVAFRAQVAIVAAIVMAYALTFDGGGPLQPSRVWTCDRGPGMGETVGPLNLALVPDGGPLIVPLTARGEVRFYSRNGDIARTIIGLTEPTGVVHTGSSGLTVVAESSPPQLRWFDQRGIEVRTLGPSVSELGFPGPLALDSDGTIYALDRRSRNIVSIDANLTKSTILPTRRLNPMAFAVGPAREVWVATIDRLARLDANGHEPFTVMLPPDALVFTIAVAPDGRVIAGGALEGRATIWTLYPESGRLFNVGIPMLLPGAIAVDATSIFAYDEMSCTFAEFRF